MITYLDGTMRAVDLFCGFGGFTAGAKAAGLEVVAAVDVCDFALQVHTLNAPEVHHVQADLGTYPLQELPEFDLLLASPPCQGFSRSSRPSPTRRHAFLRSLSWVPVEAVYLHRPVVFIIENVVDMKDWEEWETWNATLTQLGYHLTSLEVMASRCGVAQRRLRLFTVGTPGPMAPLELDAHEPALLPFLDRGETQGWRSLEDTSPGYLGRFRAAQKKHQGRPCLVQHTSGHRGISLEEPIRTITTKDQWSLLDGERWRYLTIGELARLMGFPPGFAFPDVGRRRLVKGLGNAVCPPVATRILEAILRSPVR